HRDITESMSVISARSASTVVLLRPARPFEVFLVRRSDSIAFMGGAHVFPGGRVDDADHIGTAGASDGAPRGAAHISADGVAEAAARMPDLEAGSAIAHHVAALRELFEEAGVLLARP